MDMVVIPAYLVQGGIFSGTAVWGSSDDFMRGGVLFEKSVHTWRSVQFGFCLVAGV